MGFLSNIIKSLKSKSTVKVESLTEHIMNVSTSIANRCGTVVEQDQNNVIRNTGWSFFSDTGVEQTSTVKQECFSTTSIENELHASIMNKIDQDMKVEGINLTQLGGRDSDMYTTIKNKIERNVTLQNIQEAYVNIKQKQGNWIINEGISIGSDVNIKQGATVYAVSVLSTVQKTGVFDDIRNIIRQKSSSISNLFGGILDNLFMIILVVIICIVMIIGAPYVINMMDGQKSGGFLGGFGAMLDNFVDGGSSTDGGSADWNTGEEYGYDEL